MVNLKMSRRSERHTKLQTKVNRPSLFHFPKIYSGDVTLDACYCPSNVIELGLPLIKMCATGASDV